MIAPVIAALVLAATGRAPSSAPAAVDTVDVPVGSALVDFSRHHPGKTRTLQEMTVGTNVRSAPPIIWTFTFDDTGGRPRLLATPAPEDPGVRMPPLQTYVFDRKTLAPLEIRDAKTQAAELTADGARISGRTMGPNGPAPADATLPRPAFLAPMADLVAESLPRRLDVVYRVPLWQPGTSTVEDHLYRFVRREALTVLGKTYPNAWVLEDRSADGSQLLSTMWLVDGPPELIRWTIQLPNGGILRLDQEAARSS